MTDAPAALPPAPSPSSALAGTAPVTQVSPTTQAAQVERVVAATQAALASAVNLSPQAQQRIRAEAFQQLVSSLVQHLPQASVQLPANWPTSGVPAAPPRCNSS
ncbi:MAG: hypothetical protein KIG95_06535 [Comamonas sp.]|nr:hypothetical protein [Comamonas sp.]